MTLHRMLTTTALSTLAALSAVAAHADLKYTMQTTLLGDQAKHASGFAMSMTTYVKGGMQRTDSDIAAGPIQMTNEMLTLCDKRESIQVSPAAKVYTTTSMRGMSAFMPQPPAMGGPGGRGMQGGPPAEDRGGDTGGTGTEDVTITIDDQGPDKVNDIDAHHYVLTIATKATGCAGHDSTTVKMEVWVARLVLGGLSCPNLFGSGQPASPSAAGGGCQTTTSFHGDMSKMVDIFSHMMVKTILFDPSGKPVMMNQITDYSAAPLDDSLFSVPAGYKEVSQSDFASAQSHAMMEQVMGGRNAHPQDAPSADAGADAPPAGDNSDTQPKPQGHGGIHLPHGFHF